jgi:cell cycle sensor histidine kinase DivJ
VTSSHPHVPHDAADGAPAAWQAGWALAVVAVAALGLSFGVASAGLTAALAAGAAPGVLGAMWRPADRGPRGAILCVWGVGVALAVLLTGGLGGPLAPWLAAPILAALALGGPWSAGAFAAFAALAAVAVVQVGGGAGAVPAPGVALPLGVAAAAILLGFGAAALMLREAAAAATRPNEAAPEAVAAPAPLLSDRVAEAEAARDEARAEAQSKMRLIANVSHELRTPLNAIMGFSDIMRTSLFGELTPRYAEYAELIHESGAHLLDLIGDVLDVSRIEADKYVLAGEQFDVREAVSAALRILRQQADEAGVALRGVLPPTPLDVDADRRAIKQIVLNLTANALKFTPRGGSVTVTARAAEGALELVVADTGVGIAPEDLARLGRPYEQAGDASDRARGTGLGLSLVKAFAGLHGGELLIESRLGEGTAATVRLPVLDPAATPTPSQRQA